jgi:hypothetical protein
MFICFADARNQVAMAMAMAGREPILAILKLFFQVRLVQSEMQSFFEPLQPTKRSVFEVFVIFTFGSRFRQF